MEGCAANSGNIGLRGGIINGGLTVRSCLRVVTAVRTKIAAGSEDSLALCGGCLEKDIFLRNFIGQTRVLLTEDPARADNRYNIADDARPRIVVGWQSISGFIDA